MSRSGAARDALDRTGAELTWDMIDVALTAADAVMFSDETLIRLSVELRLTTEEVQRMVSILKGAGQ